jgi:folylpolyglutamate synthase/dihydropteroate synthase
LRKSLAELSGRTPIVFVLGFLEDKEHRKMLEALLVDTDYKVAAVVGTEPQDERRFHAEDLVREAQELMGDQGEEVLFQSFTDPKDAVTRAIFIAHERDAMVAIAGSLYLAGEVRPFVRSLNRAKNAR